MIGLWLFAGRAGGERVTELFGRFVWWSGVERGWPIKGKPSPRGTEIMARNHLALTLLGLSVASALPSESAAHEEAHVLQQPPSPVTIASTRHELCPAVRAAGGQSRNVLIVAGDSNALCPMCKSDGFFREAQHLNLTSHTLVLTFDEMSRNYAQKFVPAANVLPSELALDEQGSVQYRRTLSQQKALVAARILECGVNVLMTDVDLALETDPFKQMPLATRPFAKPSGKAKALSSGVRATSWPEDPCEDPSGCDMTVSCYLFDDSDEQGGVKLQVKPTAGELAKLGVAVGLDVACYYDDVRIRVSGFRPLDLRASVLLYRCLCLCLCLYLCLCSDH